MKYKLKTWHDKHSSYPLRVFAWFPIITIEGYLVWWDYVWKYVWLKPDEYGGTAYEYSINHETAKNLQRRWFHE